MDDMVEALEDLGLPVEQLHAESAPGQFEIVTTHDDALQVRPLPSMTSSIPAMIPNVLNNAGTAVRTK